MNQAEHDQLLQELRVHQLELELQNEELRNAQQQLEFTRQQYIALYNEAPVGYASLDDAGLILRANKTLAYLLDMDLEQLLGRALVDFMESTDQEIFRGRFNAFMRNPLNKYIDVRFRQARSQQNRGGFVGRIRGRRVAESFARYSHGIRRHETLLVVIDDVTELKKTESQILHQAFHDSLTGLPNRANLYDRLEAALALARRHRRYGILLFMDMDRFKNVNDSLGHQVGDELLVNFANRLRDQIRREDLLVRMGGDEFVVLLAEQESDRELIVIKAQRFAEHLIAALNSPFFVSGHWLQMTVSVGMTLYPFDPDDGVDDIIRQADTAMYQAKEAGRNKVFFFHSDMQERVRRRLAMEVELRAGLRDRQFQIYYQPQIHLNGHIQAVEALLRWQHPERGLLLPQAFIEVAEETGLIVPLGEWVLENVAAQVAEWRQVGLCGPPTKVALNVSARQVQQAGFSDRVEAILGRFDIPPSCLMFEITESLLLPDDTHCRADLERLSRLGLAFAVDDFGTGYSSLAVLHKAPVVQLKITRQFIENLELRDSVASSKQGKLALVRTIVSMAKELGMSVVAEGVETEHERTLLFSMGCDLMQGFLFSPAVPAAEMTQLFKEGRLS